MVCDRGLQVFKHLGKEADTDMSQYTMVDHSQKVISPRKRAWLRTSVSTPASAREKSQDEDQSNLPLTTNDQDNLTEELSVFA